MKSIAAALSFRDVRILEEISFGRNQNFLPIPKKRKFYLPWGKIFKNNKLSCLANFQENTKKGQERIIGKIVDLGKYLYEIK